MVAIMWPTVYGVLVGLALGLVLVAVVAYWARPGQPGLVLCVTWLSWFLVLLPCVLVPMDLCTDPTMDRSRLVQVWRSSWWISMACGWIVIPLLQEYYQAGEFTVRARWWRAVRNNAMFYAVILVLALLSMLIMNVGYGWTVHQMDAVLGALSNTFGTGLCLCLLGYGIIEVPRTIWQCALPRQEQLTNLYHEVGYLAHDLSSYRVLLALQFRVCISGFLFACLDKKDENMLRQTK